MCISKALVVTAFSFAVFFMSRTDVVADVLFQDDFEGDSIGDEPQKWEYDPGSEVTDVGQVFEDPIDPNNQVFTDYGGYLADSGAEYTDFVAEWDWMFFLDDNRNNSVGFHVQAPDAHYQLSRRSGGSDWNIYMYDGAWNLIGSEFYPTEIDIWYRVQLSVVGEDFIVKAKEKDDDTPFRNLDPILDISDPTFETGFFSTSYYGPIDNVIIADSEQDIIDALTGGPKLLQAGDADQDFDFDQLDLVKVQIAAKYLTGQPATWGEGDWNGAPGGTQGNPPAGNGLFEQLDIIAALAPGHYLTGPYAAIKEGGTAGDEQTSLVYDTSTGVLSVDSPASNDLTSINITSAGNKFLGDKPAVLDGAFDNFATDNIFKATFGGSFGDITLGAVLPAGMSEPDVATDLTVVGSLAGGGDLGDVDLVYIPEPSTFLMIAVTVIGLLVARRRNRLWS